MNDDPATKESGGKAIKKIPSVSLAHLHKWAYKYTCTHTQVRSHTYGHAYTRVCIPHAYTHEKKKNNFINEGTVKFKILHQY